MSDDARERVDTAASTDAFGGRRSFIKSAAGLPLTAGLDGGSAPPLLGGRVEDSDRQCPPSGETVTASATTLTLLPGGSENSQPGEDGSKNACEDHRVGCEDRGDDLDNAMPDYWGSWLDAWFVGDGRSALPQNLDDALEATRDPPEAKHVDRDELRAYRLKNHLEISFPSSDSRTIDDPSAIAIDPVKGDPRPSKVLIEGEDPENVPGVPWNPLSDTEETPMKALVTGKNDPDCLELDWCDEWDWFRGRWAADAKVERYPSNPESARKRATYERVEVDGVEGVRASVIHGGSDPYIEKLSELYHALGPALFLAYLSGNEAANLSSVPIFVSDPPTMYTFVELILMADGTKLARTWDASPYPRHYLYVDGTRVGKNDFERGDGRVTDPTEWPLTTPKPVTNGDWLRNQDLNVEKFLPWLLETGADVKLVDDLLRVFGGSMPESIAGLSDSYLDTLALVAETGTELFSHVEPFNPHSELLYEAAYSLGFGDHPVIADGDDGEQLAASDLEDEFASPLFPWENSKRGGGGVQSLAESSTCDATGSFYFEYSGDGNTGTDEVVIPRRELGGAGTYEVTIEYTAALQAHSGEADLKFFLRTNDIGDTSGDGTRIERWDFRGGDREVTRTKTFTVDVDGDDDGIVLWCHLDNEQDGTSFCDAAVAARPSA